MARKMKKFSEGGAQGRYDRRMADIEKDYQNAMKRKTGRAAEIAAAKRDQRKADAEDDRAKRMGTDRTATRAAERAAESNLTKTRKYGAAQSVTKDTAGPTGKVTDSLATPKMNSSIGKKPTAKPAAKTADKPSAADIARNKFFQDSLKKTNFKTAARMAEAPMAPSKFDKAAFSDLKTGKNSYGAARIGKTGDIKTGTKTETTKGTGTSRMARAADPKDTSAAASRARAGAALSYLNPFSYISDEANDRFAKSQKAKGYAKGGKIKKMAKGGSTPPQPTAAERKADAKFRESIKKEKVTPEQAAAIGRGNRSERRFASGGVTKEMPSSKAMGSMNMAKGGKAKAKAKGNPFAATKFGAAMKKKSADTKGRAMPKFAKGGSIDGCAVRGKTKAKRVVMACSGGKMGGRK